MCICQCVYVQLSLLHVHPKLILGDSAAVLTVVHAFDAVSLQLDGSAGYYGFDGAVGVAEERETMCALLQRMLSSAA